MAKMRKPTKHSPPRIAQWLLSCVTDRSIRYSALGDFEEQFQYMAEQDGFLRANAWYRWQVIRSIPSFLADSFYWSFVMIRNYFKTAYRNLLKNKLTSFINIVGLSIAIGVSLIVFLFIEDHFIRNASHENAKKIFLIEYTAERNGDQEIWGNSPVALGPALKTDLAQIELVTRYNQTQAKVKYKDKIIEEPVQFVDRDFLDMFTFPLKFGDKSALTDQNAIIMSHESYLKYFGGGDPVAEGRQVAIDFGENNTELFVVKGVAEEFPDNADFNFDILIAFEKQKKLGLISEDIDWNELAAATFVQVRDAADIDAVQTQMGRYVELRNAAAIAKSERPITGFLFEPLLDLGINRRGVRGSIVHGSNALLLLIIALIGFSLLAIACFNYMNISMASATKRLKEIGVRKVVGGQKWQLVGQFLGENLLLCFIALLAGLALTEFFLIPGANHLFGNEEGGSLVEVLAVPSFWLFLAAMLTLTALVAGAYPAFYISSFKPGTILKEKLISQKSGRARTGILTRILLGFQFVLTFIMIVLVLVFTELEDFHRSRDWGYNQEQTIVIPIDGRQQFTMLKNEISQNADITNVAGTFHHLGRGTARGTIEDFSKTPAQRLEVERLDVGFGYVETMGLRLKEGRTFARNLRSDIDGSIIVNETLVRQMNWETAIGKRVVFDSTTYNVIGVVEDFVTRSLIRKVDPVMLRPISESESNYLAVSVSPGASVKTKEFLEKTWKELIPDKPYPGFFQDDVFAAFFRTMEQLSTIFSFISIMALIISCMGLFGMVSLSVSKRLKEISIRKVLGASMFKVMNAINKEFVRLLTIGIVIATPISYFLMRALLDSLFENHIGLAPSSFIFAGSLIFLTAFATLSSQIYKATTTNPVDVLRNE